MNLARLRALDFQLKLKVVFESVVLIVLLASMFLALSPVQAEDPPQTIYVDVENISDPYEDGSQEHPFDSIQEGIDAAISGDTIRVAPGVYFEGIVISKHKSRILLIGEEGTIIDGEGKRSGIRLAVNLGPEYLDNVTIAGFTVQNCVKGITLMRSRNARLRNNTMVGNLYNFADYSLQINDVDTSNTVDGKPVYYWVNEHDRQVPLDAGYVGLINCSNILVKDLYLTSNGQGLLLKNTAFSRIENISVINNQDGIYLDLESANNTVIGNTISGNAYMGVYLSTSSSNLISNNIILNNSYGVYLTTGHGLETINNIVINNTIEGHWKAVVLRGEIWNPITSNIIKDNLLLNNSIAISTSLSALNLFYHNNFINNEKPVENSDGENVWDYLGEGNYWSAYDGADANNDGIGDVPYTFDQYNKDNFPLRGFFKSFHIVWEETAYPVHIISNLAISNISLFQPEKSVALDVWTEDNEAAFCRVTIPTDLLGSPYHVLVSGSQVSDLTEKSNGTHAFLFFTYEGDARRIEIFGETVIPEFPQVSFVLLLLTATLFAIFAKKRFRHCTLT